ncbi:ATP phosphoribosyltransferase regulatory subunit [Mesobacterium sp. TK19101]|uniref:ATP phosphoribosyltransferase regulatory subunit n=1 Tax=Mesobacterium hydrothermale TaxID=3111907 RepID=A0ABU6HJ12_9RHOB|nr:ATP phosphoribosyltransferase regulatory subunit [Mesobacterium sp. TK19101]MEC3861820.1 ATP phosphoribosyltransferase regulatory subunit [Mesobacterium sp. TK19101]
MSPISDIRAEAARLRARFEAAGARAVDCTILQPAGTLLDLYGEDIRARAYTTSDPAQGEVMLRPDFTVPVVQMHSDSGAEVARYTYAGEVFRRQEEHPERPSEYIQVGYELFDGSAPEAADAEVFALIHAQLDGLGLRAATGDIGILTTAVAGLKTSDRRKAALMRHIWRPRRFRALLDRFSGKTPVPPTRAALLAAEDPMARAGVQIGLREATEIAARIAALRADATEPPLSREEVALIDALLNVRESCCFALQHLRDIAVDLPAIANAVDRLAVRIEAIDIRGIDPQTVEFEGSYGRTSLEYYDGFVFGFHAPARPGLPPVASGGRYDALTLRLGNGQGRPAVGGVIRPDILLTLREGRA